MIARARLLLLAAFIGGVVIVATEFPFRQLLDERSSVAQGSSQLAQLNADNRALQTQVNDMKQSSTVERIAHEQYGLVQRGQRSVVVLPGGGTGSTGPLGWQTIPKSDVFPSDSIVSPSGQSGPAPKSSGGYWSRLLSRLEFWKAVP